MRRTVPATVAACAALAGCAVVAGPQSAEPPRQVRPVVLSSDAPVAKTPVAAAPAPRRPSRALGTPTNGRLRHGVQLPARGPDHVSWDPILKRTPNRGWRRWGTDRLVATVLAVVRDVRARHPGAPRILIGDLSRPRGGVFDRRFGGLGHASHQNGLDVDVYLPRRDRRLRAPVHHREVDRRLAQALVDRFRRAGARFVFVGFRTGVRGPAHVVQAIPHHEDHLHVRLPPAPLDRSSASG